MTKKKDLRGRPKSVKKMREESLRSGKFKGQVFIAEVQKVADPALRLALLRKAQRGTKGRAWVRGENLSRVLDMIAALESPETAPVMDSPAPRGARGSPNASINPGLILAYEAYRKSGGTLPMDTWLAARRAAWDETQIKFEASRQAQPPAPFKAPAVAGPCPEEEAATAKALKQRFEAELEVTAALDADELAKFYLSRQAGEKERIYVLPDGTKRYAHNSTFFFDWSCHKWLTHIRVKFPPHPGMALNERGLLMWEWPRDIAAGKVSAAYIPPPWKPKPLDLSAKVFQYVIRDI